MLRLPNVSLDKNHSCFCRILHLLYEPDGSLNDLFGNGLHCMGGAVAEFGVQLCIAERFFWRA